MWDVIASISSSRNDLSSVYSNCNYALITKLPFIYAPIQSSINEQSKSKYIATLCEKRLFLSLFLPSLFILMWLLISQPKKKKKLTGATRLTNTIYSWPCLVSMHRLEGVLEVRYWGENIWWRSGCQSHLIDSQRIYYGETRSLKRISQGLNQLSIGSDQGWIALHVKLLQIQQHTLNKIQPKCGPSRHNLAKRPNWMGLPGQGDPAGMAIWSTTPATWTQ